MKNPALGAAKVARAAAPYAKGILAGAIAYVGAVATGYTDGIMTTGEWWAAAGAGLGALAVVVRVPNADPVPAEPALPDAGDDPGMGEDVPDGGFE
jgi:hypothetical protein